MIHADYLPGVEDVVADWESRHHNDSSNWQLSPAVFDAVNQLLDPFSLDLFASRIDHHLPYYCSWIPDPGVISVGAFSMPWWDESPYLFRPFCLIGRTYLKKRVGKISLSDCSSLAWPNMIFSAADNVGRLFHSAPSISGIALESRSETSPFAAQGEVIPDCMACLMQSYEMQGFSERVAELLIQSWRGNINSAYNSTWCKWHCWCAEQTVILLQHL